MAAFPDVEKIRFEGPKSKNLLAFHHYDENEVVEGKTMKDHFRFAVAYWHTFRGTGQRSVRPGHDACAPGKRPRTRSRTPRTASSVAFEFMEKLGVQFYCFHDRDVAPEGKTLAEINKNLDAVVKVLKEEQQRTGIKLLWGTANLFSNPRYMHGAATSRNADAFAFAAAQVKKAIEVTKELGGVGLHVLGRPRRLSEPVEHRHEARVRPPGHVHAHGRRLRQADRLQGPVLLRAQAQGADQAPVRLRRGHLHQLPARPTA